MSRTLITTRHAGAVEHLRNLGIEGEVVETLTPEIIATLGSQDKVYGPLPARLVADLTARDVRYFAIDMVVDFAQRGRELRPNEMEASGARPQRYGAYPIHAAPNGMPTPSRSPKANVAAHERTWGWAKALGVAMTAAVALQVARGIVDAGWDGFKALVASPSSAATQALSLKWITWGVFFQCLGALSALAVSVLVLRMLTGRILDVSFRPEPVEPRRVLIQGLSPLKEPASAEPFRTIPLQYAALSVSALEAEKKRISLQFATSPHDAELSDTLQQLDCIPKVQWQQNLRSILAHAPRLERVLLIPTKKSERGGGEENAVAFQSVAIGMLRRAGLGRVSVEVTSPEIDYEDHDQVLGAINKAMRSVRDSGVSDSEIAIDGTAGLKVFSIAAAVATINSRATLIYVNNQGETLAYDGRMSVADS